MRNLPEMKPLLRIHSQYAVKNICMDISSKSGMKLDPERTLERLAKKMLSHFLAGRIDNRINVILKAARDYKVDGAILFSRWIGCR